MVQYIYFVKCPNCEDEPFDFFDEAKDFALGCMSKKPIITQIEVCRNDFGECTDSNDLGTVWSWEDMMKETDAEPSKCIFTKDDFKDFEGDYNPENDPEFYVLDNSVDFNVDDIPDNFRKPVKEAYYAVIEADGEENRFPFRTEDEACEYIQYVQAGKDPAFKGKKIGSMYTEVFGEPTVVEECSSRKPIPEGMTIESLVEEMEENEDTVECKVCNDLFSKEDCHYETNMGYLCPTCKKGIKSRGETLTFEEDYSEDSDEFYDDDFYDDTGITDKDMVRYDMEYDIARDRRYFGEAKK